MFLGENSMTKKELKKYLSLAKEGEHLFLLLNNENKLKLVKEYQRQTTHFKETIFSRMIYILENPSLTLSEIGQYFNLSGAVIGSTKRQLSCDHFWEGIIEKLTKLM
jgi:hypothetical protein